MSIFQPVTLKWDDREYVVPANQVMGLIRQIEEFVTLSQVTSKHPPMGKISSGYAAALAYAGARVTDEDVYYSVFYGAAAETVRNSVAGLLQMMVPPEKILEGAPKKPKRKGVKSS